MKSFLSLVILFAAFNTNADILKPLPKGDSLAGAASGIGTQLSDNNITTGTTKLRAGLVKKTENIAPLVELGFQKAYTQDNDEIIPADAQVKTNLGSFVDGDGKNGTVYAMTTGIMESNDYTENKESREQQARKLWVVLRRLPVSAETRVGEVTTERYDSSTGTTETIRYFLLVNEDGRAVELYTRQGQM